MSQALAESGPDKSLTLKPEGRHPTPVASRVFPFVDTQHVGGRPFTLPNGESAIIDTVIRHVILEENSFSQGDEIEIDWERRYSHMRMHSLTHFLVTPPAFGLLST